MGFARLLSAVLLLASPLAHAADEDDDEEEDEGDPELDDDLGEEPADLDAPAKLSSPREGTTFSFTAPLGVGGGPPGVGFAYGISGTIGGGALSVPLYVVIADGGDKGGQYVVGLRYNAPRLFYIEALVGWVKVVPTSGATLGAGGGLGFDIPIYQHFALDVGVTVAYCLDQHQVFAMGYAGPTLHF